MNDIRVDYHDAIHAHYRVSLTSRHIVLLIADIVPGESPALYGVAPEQAAMEQLENSAEKAFRDALKSYSVERLLCNNFLTLVLGTDQPDDTPEQHQILWDSLLEDISLAAKRLYETPGLQLNIAVSSVHTNIGNGYDAFQEAHAIIDHFIYLQDGSRIITAEDIQSDCSADREQRIALEKQWFAYTSSYHFSAACDTLQEIARVKMGSMRSAVTLKSDLISRIQYTIYFLCDCEAVNHSIRSELQSKVQTIWAIHGRAELLQWIRWIYSAISQVANMDQNDIVWSERIIHFIRSNYSDPELNVDLISRRYGLSPSYVSHIFRQSTGIRLLDYIHNVRMEHVRRLLTGTDQTLSEIARQTGYENASALSRVFTRYVKQRPSEYRRAHRQSNAIP